MRILILRALKLGDFLTAVPAYRAIRRAYPRAHVTLAAPRVFTGLAALLGNAIDEIVDHSGIAPLPACVRDADLGIDLHGKGPESQRVLLSAGVRRLFAFRHEAVPETRGGPIFDPNEHEVARWCRMLAAFGIAADPGDLDLPIPNLPVPSQIRSATLVHPGAASASRRWPVERFAEVARAERARGRRVLVSGGPDEVELAHAVASGAGLAASDVYAGRTSVAELAAIVAASGRVVCGDTGLAHLATAYRRPSVVLFGPTPPATWGPPVRSHHRVLWNGSTGDPHAAGIDAGLLGISVERVLEALAALDAA